MQKFNIVAAFLKSNRGMGFKNRLPWPKISKDMKHFQKITTKKDHRNIVIMGRKTFKSLPFGMLSDRENIILSRKYASNLPNCYDDLDTALDEILANDGGKSNMNNNNICNSQPLNVNVIGGAQIYEQAISDDRCDKLFLTEINDDKDKKDKWPVDCFFPEIPKWFRKIEAEEHPDMTFCVYQNILDKESEEYQYLDLCKDILAKGDLRQTRNAKVKSIFGPQHVFDLANGFPLLTTKKMQFSGIIKELLFFLKGLTDSRVLAQDGVPIWDGNTTREFLDSRGLHHYYEGDMGPMYGFQWRHSGAEYEPVPNGPKSVVGDPRYLGEGYDQLYHLIHDLYADPNSRRLLMTTYDPAAVAESVLAPCHGLTIQFYVSPDGRLNCKMYQRSVDVALGYPYNIASYAALVHILAHVTGYQPGKLITTLGDTHIYKSHFGDIGRQLIRTPYKFPELEILPKFEYDTGSNNTSVECKTSEAISFIENLKPEDFKIKNYNCYPRIKMEMIA